MRRWSLAAFLLHAACRLAAQADTRCSRDRLSTSVYGSFQPSDGIPDAGARARLQPSLSPALNKLLSDAAAAQARFSAKIKDSPPLIEGDLFSSLFEGATPGPGSRPVR